MTCYYILIIYLPCYFYPVSCKHMSLTVQVHLVHTDFPLTEDTSSSKRSKVSKQFLNKLNKVQKSQSAAALEVLLLLELSTEPLNASPLLIALERLRSALHCVAVLYALWMVWVESVCLCAVHDKEPVQASGLRGEPGLWRGHQDPRLLPRDRLGPVGAEKSETAL